METLLIRGVTGGVLYLSGELDLASVGTFTECVRSCVDGEGEVVLDLSDVSFIDSSGVGAVVKLARDLGDRPIVLRSPSRSVRKVLEIVRIDDYENIRISGDH
jgi:anti-sigma B factor antagonist